MNVLNICLDPNVLINEVLIKNAFLMENYSSSWFFLPFNWNNDNNNLLLCNRFNSGKICEKAITRKLLGVLGEGTLGQKQKHQDYITYNFGNATLASSIGICTSEKASF